MKKAFYYGATTIAALILIGYSALISYSDHVLTARNSVVPGAAIQHFIYEHGNGYHRVTRIFTEGSHDTTKYFYDDVAHTVTVNYAGGQTVTYTVTGPNGLEIADNMGTCYVNDGVHITSIGCSAAHPCPRTSTAPCNGRLFRRYVGGDMMEETRVDGNNNVTMHDTYTYTTIAHGLSTGDHFENAYSAHWPLTRTNELTHQTAHFTYKFNWFDTKRVIEKMPDNTAVEDSSFYTYYWLLL